MVKETPWMRDRDASIEIQRSRNGGKLELDIAKYNERIRFQNEEALKFSKYRIAMDHRNEELWLERELKEAWE